ncbi:type II secretion system F family protein [Streptomyces minutiscleroticus]|uniref:Membrane protein n=1 Tax=Streptomyces minutiscleroticus TaxID=68238 RepID=A0A918NKE1_9ACTN|nr:type II secretion system F family protein [Streptomyces minutiscleroticus]GGX74716.1 membrane protein [Streptomyces minutiscleroticus]
MSPETVHRLGAAVCAMAALWSVAHVSGGVRGRRRARERLAGLLDVTPARRTPRCDVRAAVRRGLPVAGAVCAGWVLIGGVPGGATGLVAGAGLLWWRLRRAPREAVGAVTGREAARAGRQVPLAADLLAACVMAGASPVAAARAVGEALGGPLGGRLARGAAEVRLGADPATAWREVAAVPDAAALARLLERAGESGVPAAGPVARLAAEARARRARTATARARRAGVMITAPVGLCFLPAFIAVGVLPVVIGLAGGLLEGGGG